MPTRAPSDEPPAGPSPAPSPDASAGPVLGRRTALGGLVLLGAVATGCTGPAREPAAPSRPSPAASGTDPDVALAAAVLAGERHVLATVRATLRRHHRSRDLRAVLRAARDVHLAHVRLLADAVPSGAPSTGAGQVPAPPAGRDAALLALARAEDRLAASTRRSAFDARSGAFARVLASVAAAAAQQSTVLRDHVGGRLDSGSRR